MAETAEVFCGICDAQHITKCAEYWCPDCEEGLCGDCKQRHCLSKGTVHHGIISVDNYKGHNSSMNRSMPLSDIVLKIKSEFSVRTGARTTLLRCCVICQDGKIVLGDSGNNRLIVLNPDGTFYKEMFVPEPYDITVVDENRVAITTKPGIKIINLKSEKIRREFDSGYSYGITYNNGCLIYCQALKGIEKIDLANGKWSNFSEHTTEVHWTNITTFDNKIYHSNHFNNTITAYKMNGEILWRFRDDTILTNPRSLTVDNNGNVYVASWDTYSIFVISSDGKMARHLPSREDGKRYIQGIYFDKNNNVLLRTQTTGNVHIYNI